VSDDTQSVVWRWDSTPFGEGAPVEDPDGDSNDFVLNLRFPGQYYDAESGLHYNYFRDYDPGVGRYVGSDPARFINGTNLFAYVRSNPILFVDPLGLALLGRVSCDGNGNWQKEIFTEDECLVDCVDRHEQIHLEYVSVLFGKEACEGVPAGQMPTADVRIASQYNATYTHQECRALKDSNSCFSDLAKKGCESGCREKAENLIEQIMRQATNLGCWWAL
jgi:RHS repeat-associated protein